jgi:hypothetical protein
MATHAPPERHWPVGQPHAPPEQIWPAGQAWPHAPQLVALVAVFSHVRPQGVSPVEHAMHRPEMHAWPAGHDVAVQTHAPVASHVGVAPVHAAQLAPQWVALLVTHVPPHEICPAGQLVHAPALQFCPDGHAAHDGPQWVLSCAWQAAPHITSVAGQTQWPAVSHIAPLAALQLSAAPQNPLQPFDPHWRPVQSIGWQTVSPIASRMSLPPPSEWGTSWVIAQPAPTNRPRSMGKSWRMWVPHCRGTRAVWLALSSSTREARV